MKNIQISEIELEEIKKIHLEYCTSKVKNLKLTQEQCRLLFIENPFDEFFRVKPVYDEFKKNKFNFEKQYKNFRNSKINQKWNGAKLIESLKLNVCPYCSQQYFSIVTVEDRLVAEANLDHYISRNKSTKKSKKAKSKNNDGYLALNLYNLIPVCRCCNSSFKLAKEKPIINPYFDSLDDYIKFELDNFSIIDCFLKDEKIKLNIKNMAKGTNKEELTENHINLIKIKDRYEYYQNLIKSLIFKRLLLNNSYISSLDDYLKDIIQTNIENLILRQDIFSDEEPFLKFKNDIWEQLSQDYF